MHPNTDTPITLVNKSSKVTIIVMREPLEMAVCKRLAKEAIIPKASVFYNEIAPKPSTSLPFKTRG